MIVLKRNLKKLRIGGEILQNMNLAGQGQNCNLDLGIVMSRQITQHLLPYLYLIGPRRIQSIEK